MTRRKKLKKGDLLLLLLYVDNCSPIRGRTRLQKMVFVFEEEIYEKYGFNRKLEEKFEFKSYNYGPFSNKLFELMDFFVNIDMVESIDCKDNMEDAFGSTISDMDIVLDDLDKAMPEYDTDNLSFGEVEYRIKEKGRKYTKEKLIIFLDNNQIKALTKLKTSFNKSSLDQILKYVYTKYPDMAEDSLIREKVSEKPW